MGPLEKIKEALDRNEARLDKHCETLSLKGIQAYASGYKAGKVVALRNVVEELTRLSQCEKCETKFKVILTEVHVCSKCWNEWSVTPMYNERK
tara:strand:- start:4243 stop:4521 length:279 start_codon:yes stop_codon:yes gene_type:complete